MSFSRFRIPTSANIDYEGAQVNLSTANIEDSSNYNKILYNNGGVIEYQNFTTEKFISTYDASTNTPILADNDSYKIADFFVATVGGTNDYGSGSITLGVNDAIIKKNDGKWAKFKGASASYEYVDTNFRRKNDPVNTGTISTVAGETRISIADAGEVLLGQWLDIQNNGIRNVGHCDMNKIRTILSEDRITFPNSGNIQMGTNIDMGTSNITNSTNIKTTNTETTNINTSAGQNRISIPDAGEVLLSGNVDMQGYGSRDNFFVDVERLRDRAGNWHIKFDNVNVTCLKTLFMDSNAITGASTIDSTNINVSTLKTSIAQNRISLPDNGDIIINTHLDCNSKNLSNVALINGTQPVKVATFTQTPDGSNTVYTQDFRTKLNHVNNIQIFTENGAGFKNDRNKDIVIEVKYNYEIVATFPTAPGTTEIIYFQGTGY